VRLTAEEDRLKADLDVIKAELTPIVGGFRLRLKFFGLFSINVDALAALRISFPRVASRRFVVVDRDGRRFPVGSQITAAPTPAAWKPRLGRYTLADEDEDAPFVRALTLTDRAGLLLMELETVGGGAWRLALAPWRDNSLIVSGVGRQLGGEVKFDPERNLLSWQGLDFQRSTD
jgi:hypothetical protein